MLLNLVPRNNINISLRTLCTNSRTQLFRKGHLLHNQSITFISRFLCDTSNPNLTVNYLKNSCGLSPESALKASKHLHLKCTTSPNSVLSLLNSYGITKPQIIKLITLRPTILLANPDTALKPKLEYFRNMGIAGPHLGKLVSSTPSIWALSLEDNIIPYCNYLRTLVSTTNRVASILKRSWFVSHSAKQLMESNVTSLLDHGVPRSNISKFLMLNPQSFFRNSDKFNETVLQLVSMGISPSNMAFLRGLQVYMGAKKSLWEHKLAVYRSFGWSEDEVLSLFKKQPFVMAGSMKRISLALDFFMNKMNWTREDLARNSSAILYSLERRVIPRCHVLQILVSKNLMSQQSMGQALRVTEAAFLKKCVRLSPDLLEVYQHQMRTQGLSAGAKAGKS